MKNEQEINRKYTGYPQVNNILWIILCKLDGGNPLYLWITSIDGTLIFKYNRRVCSFWA